MTDHVDMSQFIAARSDQMNADDLLDAPRTITVTKVSATPDSAEQPVSIHYEGDQGKPFKPCKTVRRIMVGVWGKDASQYVGRSMTLYRDPTVAFGGMQVGGIRVSHMSHMDGEKTVALMVTRGRKAPFKVLPLKTKVQPAGDQAVALKAITDAAEQGMDALSNAWKQKWMAPHREALQVDLDRLKLVAAAKGTPRAEPEQPERPAEQPPEVNDVAGGQSLADQIADKPGESAVGNAPASGVTDDPPVGSSSSESSSISTTSTTATTDASPSDDAHPGTAIADAIIAEINKPETNAIMDVAAILNRNSLDMAAMLDADAVRVEVAADKRRAAIRAEQATAKVGAE